MGGGLHVRARAVGGATSTSRFRSEGGHHGDRHRDSSASPAAILKRVRPWRRVAEQPPPRPEDDHRKDLVRLMRAGRDVEPEEGIEASAYRLQGSLSESPRSCYLREHSSCQPRGPPVNAAFYYVSSHMWCHVSHRPLALPSLDGQVLSVSAATRMRSPASPVLTASRTSNREHGPRPSCVVSLRENP